MDYTHVQIVCNLEKVAKGEILIVAGEISGDLHGAELVKNFLKLSSDYCFFGAGGELMKSEGVELLSHVNDLAVMGFSGIPKILPTLKALKRNILNRVRKNPVNLAILVDYPGFNLNLAKALKQLPNPPKILEYIAPQVWAWRANRTRKILSYIDHLAVVFPFEERLFKAANVPVTFVGHPLLDELNLPTVQLKDTNDPKSAILSSDVDEPIQNPILALLPGSRKTVAVKHLPIMIESAKLLINEFPNIRFCIGCAPGLRQHLEGLIHGQPIKYELWDDSRKLLSEATAAVVCSGTATLETALIGTPQVIVYKTSSINYAVIKKLIKLPYVGLVNIVAEDKIITELLQDEFNPVALYRAIAPMIRCQIIRDHAKSKMMQVRNKLGEPGASRRVAELAYQMIK